MYLKEFRERLNLTQRELSEILKIAQNAIARYENNKVKPSSTVFLKYIEKLNASPNFLFLGIEPIQLKDIPSLNLRSIDLLNDITLVLSQDDLTERLNNMLISKIFQKFEIENNSSILKFLEILNLDQPVKIRPFLFLYHIFQQIQQDFLKNEKKIENYKNYLEEIVTSYKVLSLRNQSLFTDTIKNEIKDFIDIKLSEDECEILVKNYKSSLEILESKMPASMIKYHRDIFK